MAGSVTGLSGRMGSTLGNACPMLEACDVEWGLGGWAEVPEMLSILEADWRAGEVMRRPPQVCQYAKRRDNLHRCATAMPATLFSPNC